MLDDLGAKMIGLEVSLVIGHFVPFIVKVLLVDCDPLELVEWITPIEDNKGLLAIILMHFPIVLKSLRKRMQELEDDDEVGNLDMEPSFGVLSSHGSRFPEIKLAFMEWNVIACLHGMDMIACLHNMVDKLAFMAWLLACLCGMDGKVSEIGSTGRKDDIKNEKD
ncbi:hypothetical protein Tco_1500661 [Tanacetum coccineum]